MMHYVPYISIAVDMLNKNFEIIFFIMFILSNILVSETKHRLKNKDFRGKVVGGTPVPLEEYPFAVQFFNLGGLCGGVIMNTWAVLTSAHCLDVNKDINEMRIQVGSRFIYDFKAKRHELQYFVIHENYNKGIPFANDIAILFVKQQIEFNNFAKKGVFIKHNKWMSAHEKNFVVVGWGNMKPGGPVSDLNLMKTHLRYVPLRKCGQIHKLQLTADMFCLYGDGKRDACHGDSGGGVVWRGSIVGLTSHGDGCAKINKPSVFTNVWYLKPWIRNQMNLFITNRCNTILCDDVEVLSDGGLIQV